MKRIILFFTLIFSMNVAVTMGCYTYEKRGDSIYFACKKMEEVNIETFQILTPFLYAKDKKNVYYKDDILIGADTESIEIVARYNGYIKDKDHVYYEGKLVNGADPKTFEALSYSLYSKDRKNVYFENKKIIGIDVKTFEIIEKNYAKDKKSVYFQGQKLNGSDPKTFKPCDPFFSLYSKDKRYVYYRDVIVRGADPNTLKLLATQVVDSQKYEFRSEYISDRSSVYFKEKEIIGVDTETFEVLNSSLSRDKNDFYYNGEKLNVDIKTFEYALIGSCIKGEDKNKKYEYNCDVEGWVLIH